MNFNCLELEDVVGFNWDDGNITKNEKKHNLKWQVIEEVFVNKPLLLLKDEKHSQIECRCLAFGFANNKKLILVAFTKRDNQIRIISARMMNKKERIFYESNTKV